MADRSIKNKFSIVTSFFGEGKKYVERLYEDIKNQRVDWEWLVTDDFSNDLETQNALVIISAKDPRVKYYQQEEKRELFRNPQKFSSGEYVFHIDADDQVHPSYLEHCKYWFERFPKVICILSGSEWIKENGHFNRYTFHSQHEVGTKHDFIGRVWRNGFEFEFESIFSNHKDVIRMNDMFIVKSFEKTGDILCLPRPYIKYEMRASSNCNVERTEEEKEKIARCKEEFLKWNSKNSIPSPYDPFFFDVEKEFLSFFPLQWSKERQVIQFSGRIFPVYKQRKLKELYQDYDIYFGEVPPNVYPAYKIIDCTEKFEKFDVSKRSTIVLLGINDEEAFGYYNQQFTSLGKMVRWIKLWDYRWMITIN